MANICTNIFYAHSGDSDNIKRIKEFINEFAVYTDYQVCSTNELNLEFGSKWDFPYRSMVKLGQLLDNSKPTEMKCLSYELGNDYATYWKYDKNGWRQII